MLLNLNSIFLGDVIFFINEMFFFSLIISLLCLSLYLNKHIKSLELNKLIIELALPFLSLNLFFIYFLIGLDLNFLFHFKFILFLLLCLISFKNYFFFMKKKNNNSLVSNFSIFKIYNIVLLFCSNLDLVYYFVEYYDELLNDIYENYFSDMKINEFFYKKVVIFGYIVSMWIILVIGFFAIIISVFIIFKLYFFSNIGNNNIDVIDDINLNNNVGRGARAPLVNLVENDDIANNNAANNNMSNSTKFFLFILSLIIIFLRLLF